MVKMTAGQLISLSHPTVTVLNEVTFRLTKGEFLGIRLAAVVAASRASLSLLMRFYGPFSRGTISLDGLISRTYPEWLRSQSGNCSTRANTLMPVELRMLHTANLMQHGGNWLSTMQLFGITLKYIAQAMKQSLEKKRC
ncbi:hypothetical protein ACHAWO_003979 [Cyclotella atomus]|uniref:Uncharacterized protein n=1 Tax=Cyclotella atomus TaxID=382360 RepID=A0ABD3PV54_9STRA